MKEDTKYSPKSIFILRFTSFVKVLVIKTIGLKSLRLIKFLFTALFFKFVGVKERERESERECVLLYVYKYSERYHKVNSYVS